MFGNKPLPEILYGSLDLSDDPLEHIVDQHITWQETKALFKAPVIPALEVLGRPCFDWCTENCKGEFRLTMIPWGTKFPPGIGDGFRWSFERDDDAALFKLFNL